jgi:antirestriction protein ArdC
MSAEIKRYLTFFAGFRGHSFYNTLLIWIQKPDAKKVAGFRQWEKKFRRVKKGAKGIMIFAPVMSKTAKDDTQVNDAQLDNEVKKGMPVRFMPVYVFDISDTEAIDERGDVPEAPKWFQDSEPTERTKELYKYLSEILDVMGVKLTKGDAKAGEKGYSAGNHINMSSEVEGAGEVSTLVHELAHELMHWKKSSIYYQGDEVKYDSAIKELQAESVAYIVMKHYGLPVTHQTTYLALWKANKEKILANIKVISDVAKFIIDEIDKVANSNSSSGQVDEDIDLYL